MHPFFCFLVNLDHTMLFVYCVTLVRHETKCRSRFHLILCPRMANTVRSFSASFSSTKVHDHLITRFLIFRKFPKLEDTVRFLYKSFSSTKTQHRRITVSLEKPKFKSKERRSRYVTYGVTPVVHDAVCQLPFHLVPRPKQVRRTQPVLVADRTPQGGSAYPQWHRKQPPRKVPNIKLRRWFIVDAKQESLLTRRLVMP
jgi:hypothetical protein